MGSERQNLSIFTCSNGFRLLIKNSEEVVVPQCARADVLNELHSTHMCSNGMKRLSRGKFTWKNIGKDIEKLYNQCEMCKEHSRSKPNIPGKTDLNYQMGKGYMPDSKLSITSSQLALCVKLRLDSCVI